MFGKKKKIIQPRAEIKVQTIPDDFYGNANPVVKFKDVEKVAELRKQGGATRSEKVLLDKSTAAGGDKWWHPANFLTNRRFLLVAGVVIFIIFVAGAAVYYWNQAAKEQRTAEARKKELVAPPSPAVETPSAPASAETAAAEDVAAEAKEEAPSPISLSESPMEFPSRLLGRAPDLDDDGLTDAEEDIFNTDPSISDTDEDGYADGHEVYYLYSPAGKEPLKLIISQAVAEFENPAFGYKLYFPANWAVGNVDQNYRQVLFNALTGENIEVRVFDLEPGMAFADWFGQWAPGEQYGDLREFENYFQEKGWSRSDGLVYYFTDAARVYAIVYHESGSSAVNFPSVIQMLARSFRTAGNADVMPAPVAEEQAAGEAEGVLSAPTSATSADSVAGE